MTAIGDVEVARDGQSDRSDDDGDEGVSGGRHPGPVAKRQGVRATSSPGGAFGRSRCARSGGRATRGGSARRAASACRRSCGRSSFSARARTLSGFPRPRPRLGVSRTTVYQWVERNILLAWRSTKRGLSIPAAQILGPGRVVPGLADVVDVLGDPELAWEFLIQEWPFEDETAVPLELLMAGRVEDVLDAAPGFGATFT